MDKKLSLSGIFSDILTSPYNQHVTCMTVGPTGSGKSMFNLALTEQLSIKISDFWGGSAEKYFNIDHIAIMTKDEVKRTVKLFGKRKLFLLDDVGTAWNSRNYKEKKNIMLNDIFQTFRPNNNFLGSTLPDSFLIDKVPRALVHYFIEMESRNFKKGFTVAKVFEVVRKPRIGKSHFQYLQSNGKILRFISRLPSENLIDQYMSKREKAYNDLLEENLTKWDAIDAIEKKALQPKIKKKELIPLVQTLIDSGEKNIKEACAQYGITPRYYRQIKNEV